MRFETPKGIGVAIALWAKTHVRKLKKVSMDGNVRAEPCTRKLAWLDSTTCMVPLAEVHGSAFVVAWMDSKSPILESKITLAICRKSPLAKIRDKGVIQV